MDVARLAALRDNFDSGAIPRDFVAPPDISEADVARTRSSMRAQAGEQLAKISALDRQIEQKRAEADSVVAAIAKIDATMPLLDETASIRKKAMEIQFGNHIAYLDAQTKLVEQQNERLVQQRKLVEIEAARKALEEQIDQTTSGPE